MHYGKMDVAQRDGKNTPNAPSLTVPINRDRDEALGQLTMKTALKQGVKRP
jgi:hypothetical protein